MSRASEHVVTIGGMRALREMMDTNDAKVGYVVLSDPNNGASASIAFTADRPLPDQVEVWFEVAAKSQKKSNA